MNLTARTRVGRTAIAAIAIVASLLGCDVQTFDEAAAAFNNNAPPPPPSPPPPSSFGPVFSEIQAAVFTPNCATANCHSGANPPANLNLEEANSYAMLVGVASDQDANFQRVNPMNPDISYLVMKLEGSGSGQQMPPNNAMPQADIDVIRQWITDGAVDDRVQASNPIRVTSMSPAPGATLNAAPAQLIIGFDRDVDASTVNANTFQLVASGGDGTFGEANDVPITAATITVPGTNPASAMFDLTGTNLADDTYQVSLFGTGSSVILDLDANALDGEYSGALPSGDGAAGGNFVVPFSIATAVTLEPTLDSIQAVIFDAMCASCHTGPTSNSLPSGMDLTTADASYDALLGPAGTGVPSIQQPTIMRVLPNDPDNSYLVQKLEGTAATGTTMPPGSPLDPADIAEIRQWIIDGALR